MSAQPTPSEQAQARAWFDAHLSAAALREGRFPLVFGYGEAACAPLPTWTATEAEQPGERRLTRTLTVSDPATGLQIRCEATLFTDYPAVEWIAYLQNTGSADTPILDGIALGTEFALAKETGTWIHQARGSTCQQNDFEPLKKGLWHGERLERCSRSGRSSDPYLPFFNLQIGENGVIGAIGWTGGWKLAFVRSPESIAVHAGVTKTHLKLHPGEEIRTPRLMLLFWECDRRHAQNMLRQFLLAHHTPQPNGKLLQGPICWANWGEVRVADQLAKLQWWQAQKLPLDVFWIDAGWYGNAPFLEDSTVYNSQWYTQAGNWWPNPVTYPEGFRPIGDACREAGVRFLLWIEPERCRVGSSLAKEHAEWLLGPRDDSLLINLGIPAARQFLTDLVSDLLTEGGINFYRQDFNTDPVPFWEAEDAPDRVGMTEIGHITGLYAMWDELVERHPGLMIDNCSSGGRRIDLEMISRSIALWRSDYQCVIEFDALAMQGQTSGLSEWVPLSAGVFEKPNNRYAMRSGFGPSVVIGNFEGGAHHPEALAAVPLDLLRSVLEEEVRVRPYFYGDFYPLLSYTLSTDAWAAWQFDRPDLGEGMAQFFRRQDCPFATMEGAKLQGLNPGATYEVEAVDSGKTWRATGRELMEEGFNLTIADRPGSALLIYKQA
jgi:alpha-galactosidase